MLTAEKRALLRDVVAWLLDQDHDTIEGDYLWFLTPSQEVAPHSEDEVSHVRALLNELLDDLAPTT